MLKITRQHALLISFSILIVFAGTSLGQTDAVNEKARELAFRKGLNWLLKHPQRIEEHVQLYNTELAFYYLMAEKSKAHKEREFFKETLLQRLRQSDRFKFKISESIYDTCSYVSILGYRKWSRKWEARETATDSKLLDLIQEDIRKNATFYEKHLPLELIFIDYKRKKFDLDLTGFAIPQFKWWVFLAVNDVQDKKPADCTGLNEYDLLVGYTVTHVILIDSDYGLKHLESKTYSREYQYLVKNMQKFMCNNHVDLVSEFLICLEILGASDSATYLKAMRYLISSQKEDGSWPKNVFSINNKHTTIVALWALAAYQ